MKIKARLFLLLPMVIILFLFFSLNISFAKDKFPERNILIINPYSAGGTGDVEIRTLIPYLEKYLGVSVITQNQTGAGGKIAYSRMYKEKPDGYTILYNNMPASNLGETLYSGNYKVREFTYIQNFIKEFRLIAVRYDSPYRTLDDLINASKEKVLTCAVSGLGSSGHMGAILLQEIVGFKHKIVPFAGSSKAKAAFLGGHVDFWTPGSGRIKALLEEKKIRLLAVLGAERISAYPNIPTLKELGYPSISVITARGFCGPPNLPEDVTKILIDAFSKATKEQKLVEWARNINKPICPLSDKNYYKLYVEIQTDLERIFPMAKKAISE